jgi:hypothetical protein
MKTRKFLSLTRLELRPLGYAYRRQSLYPLSYPGIANELIKLMQLCLCATAQLGPVLQASGFQSGVSVPPVVPKDILGCM